MGKVLILSARPLLKNKEEKTLAQAGLPVTALSNYDVNLEKNGGMNFDVIVLDDTLRDIDTNETCRRIRESTKATIILLGNQSPTEMWEKCKEIGFDHYYRKPMSSRELAYQIKRLMEWVETNGEPDPSTPDHIDSPSVEADMEIDVVKESRQTIPEPIDAPASTPGVWHDPRVANLMSGLLKGKIDRLSPQIDLSLDEGFS
ncbi:MAG: hypothetical protein A2Y89_06880, partial [Chloroflexi bacterium RBG_13_51_18]